MNKTYKVHTYMGGLGGGGQHSLKMPLNPLAYNVEILVFISFGYIEARRPSCSYSIRRKYAGRNMYIVLQDSSLFSLETMMD
jgi:hypothetical protein